MLLFSMFTSCYYARNKGQFKDFGKVDFCNNGKLKLNGYFYTEYEGGKGNSISIYDLDAIRPIIFYSDGKVRVYPQFMSQVDSSKMYINLNSFEKINKYFKSYLKKTSISGDDMSAPLGGWGKWRVNGDSLRIMYYVAGSAAVPFPIFDYWLLEYDGKILNDTTFILEKYISHTTGRIKILDEIYKFEKYHIKPDSSIVDY